MAAQGGEVVTLPVTINGVPGRFILDTGASFVSLKASFAAKAKVEAKTTAAKAKLEKKADQVPVAGEMAKAAAAEGEAAAKQKAEKAATKLRTKAGQAKAKAVEKVQEKSEKLSR